MEQVDCYLLGIVLYDKIERLCGRQFIESQTCGLCMCVIDDIMIADKVNLIEMKQNILNNDLVTDVS